MPKGLRNCFRSAMRKIVLTVLLVAGCFAQSPRPEFEVASIRPSPSAGPDRVDIGLHIDGSQVRAGGLSLRDYVGIAYRTKVALISGPEWTASERFDISAALPAGAKTAQLPEMFQALLADRFQLKFHKDKKEFPVYALLVGKGPLKLKESPPGSDADNAEPEGAVNLSASGSAAGVGVNYGHGTSYSFANNKFEAQKLTMALFAGNLERFADRQIVDMTGLTGKYDFAFEVTPEDYRAMLIRSAIAAGVVLPPEALRALSGSSGDSLMNALDRLGLKLEPRKAPLEVLVVDRMEKAPTEN